MANGNADADGRKLKRLIKGIDVAMLTTVSHAGMLRSRPMAVVDIRADSQIWFFTRSAPDRTDDDVREGQRVNLSFADERGGRYVSVSGTAAVVHDVDLVRELWNKKLKAWFPLGKKDPELALLRVDVEGAEYWDGQTVRVVPSSGLRSPAAASGGAELRRPEATEVPPPVPPMPTEGRGGAQG